MLSAKSPAKTVGFSWKDTKLQGDWHLTQFAWVFCFGNGQWTNISECCFFNRLLSITQFKFKINTHTFHAGIFNDSTLMISDIFGRVGISNEARRQEKGYLHQVFNENSYLYNFMKRAFWLRPFPTTQSNSSGTSKPISLSLLYMFLSIRTHSQTLRTKGIRNPKACTHKPAHSTSLLMV